MSDKNFGSDESNEEKIGEEEEEREIGTDKEHITHLEKEVERLKYMIKN